MQQICCSYFLTVLPVCRRSRHAVSYLQATLSKLSNMFDFLPVMHYYYYYIIIIVIIIITIIIVIIISIIIIIIRYLGPRSGLKKNSAWVPPIIVCYPSLDPSASLVLNLMVFDFIVLIS
jgi:hypothetical protein